MEPVGMDTCDVDPQKIRRQGEKTQDPPSWTWKLLKTKLGHESRAFTATAQPRHPARPPDHAHIKNITSTTCKAWRTISKAENLAEDTLEQRSLLSAQLMKKF